MNEILVIMQEECAEVIQAISKIHRFGLYDKHEGNTNFYQLIKELGDLQCMMNLFIEKYDVDTELLKDFEMQKLDKLKSWSKIV